MMASTREDDFVSRAAGEWYNSPVSRILYFLYDYEEKLINKKKIPSLLFSKILTFLYVIFVK
jgi:hypothetical protein